MPTLLTENDHVRQGNTCREGRVSWDQPRLQSQVAGPSAPQFWDSHVFTLRRRTTEFGVVTHMGMRVLWVSRAIAYRTMRRAVCQRQPSFLSHTV